MNGPAMSVSFARRFVPVWVVGLIGVLGLLMQAPPTSLLDQAPQLRELPPAALRALLLVNPLALVTLFALVGAAVAHRVQLRSRLAGDKCAQFAPGVAVLVGLLLAVVLSLVDAALVDTLGEAWRAVLAQAKAAPQVPALLMGVLYGGLAEEVMMRWGLMSLIAWLLWTAQRRFSVVASQPSAAVMWTAVVVGADPNLSHRADRILSQGWGPAFRGPAVDKCRSVLAL